MQNHKFLLTLFFFLPLSLFAQKGKTLNKNLVSETDFFSANHYSVNYDENFNPYITVSIKNIYPVKTISSIYLICKVESGGKLYLIPKIVKRVIKPSNKAKFSIKFLDNDNVQNGKINEVQVKMVRFSDATTTSYTFLLTEQ